MLIYLEHPNHKGVKAPMRNKEALEAHIKGGWTVIKETKEPTQAEKKAKLVKSAKKFGIKLDARYNYQAMLDSYERQLEGKGK